MTDFQPITAEWGTHWANVRLADQWWDAAHTLAMQLRAIPPRGYAAQRDALLAAWGAFAFAYQAANIPPPSDPRFRNVLVGFYGDLTQVDPANLAAQKFGPVASKGGGTFGGRFARAWITDLRKDHSDVPLVCAAAVRVCLDSNAHVTHVCTDLPGVDACSFRGLFTGCARPDAMGKFYELPCDDSTYDWNVAEWHDPPGMACTIERANYPLSWSLDLLDALLATWDERGGAAGVIDTTRAFVVAVNMSNAIKSGRLPAEYMAASLSLQADAQALSTGSNAARSSVVAIATTVAAVAAQAGGPYGAVVAALAMVVAAVASVWPVAVGIAQDRMGVPMAQSDLSAAWLPAIIKAPNPDTHVYDAFHPEPVIPPASVQSSLQASTSTPAPALRVPGAAGAIAGAATGAAQAAAARLATGLAPTQPTYTIVGGQTGGAAAPAVPGWVIAAGVAGLIWWATKGKR